MSYEVEIKEVQESRNHTYFALRLIAPNGNKSFLCRVDQDAVAASFIARACEALANANEELASAFMDRSQ